MSLERRDVSCCHQRSTRCQSLRQIDRAWGDGSQTHVGGWMKAAMELYGERGFEQTTVAEIAARAGLTERTFFRTSPTSARSCSRARTRCRSSSSTRLPKRPRWPRADRGGRGRDRGGRRRHPGGRRAPRQRQAIIVASAELQERELIKLASLAVGARRRCARAVSPSRPRASPPRRASPSSGSPSNAGSTRPASRTCRGHPRVARRAEGRDRGPVIAPMRVAGRRSAWPEACALDLPGD